MANASKWGRLIEGRAAPVLGDIAVRGRLVYQTRIGAILNGIYAEPSRFTKGASYVWVFAQPLYVPSEHLDFTIGTRLGGGTHTYTLEDLATAEIATHMKCSAGVLHQARDPNGAPRTGRLKEPRQHQNGRN